MADQTHYLPRHADLQDSADEESDSLRAQLAALKADNEEQEGALVLSRAALKDEVALVNDLTAQLAAAREELAACFDFLGPIARGSGRPLLDYLKVGAMNIRDLEADLAEARAEAAEHLAGSQRAWALADAHAADNAEARAERDALREALGDLIAGVEEESKASNSISGWMGARLSDARRALSRREAGGGK